MTLFFITRLGGNGSGSTRTVSEAKSENPSGCLLFVATKSDMTPDEVDPSLD